MNKRYLHCYSHHLPHLPVTVPVSVPVPVPVPVPALLHVLHAATGGQADLPGARRSVPTGSVRHRRTARIPYRSTRKAGIESKKESAAY